uniref:TCDD inducible poly(ADP-ribose) polymerase n=1 Tax=Cynoglossus semilaevis TaxID=244447 RepID=A0A3P8UHK0_CYNSE
MDKTLQILQKAADGVPDGISLDMMEEEEGFTEQPIVGLSDKIPLVKPYFKKKQRKLDAKCLHRALEDPMLSTLLSTDTLVSGDGVFVLRNQPGRTAGNLCTAAVVKQNRLGQVCLKDSGAAADSAAAAEVPALIAQDGDAEIADTTAELEETERRAEQSKITSSTPDSRCFQLKPALRASGNTVTIQPSGRDIPPLVTPRVPHQQRPNKSNDLSPSGTKGLRVKECTGVQKPTPLLLQPDNGVLFQDKSEEASLDLVFELLTQLQYHTHQSDLVDICVDFLHGQCVFGNDCVHHHTVLPYHWQIHRTSSQSWQSVADDSQEQLERLYCNPDNEQVRLKFQKKEYMSRRLSEMDRLLCERHLFHGTSADVVDGICKHNFDPRVCGKHATMFGQGSYFARKAVYSHNFSKRSSKGVHCMFLAKVLTGRFTVGNPSMRRPPPLNPRDPSSDLYDSCVDNWMDPQIYVIFNDDQSYPYFIIHYEEVPSTVTV